VHTGKNSAMNDSKKEMTDAIAAGPKNSLVESHVRVQSGPRRPTLVHRRDGMPQGSQVVWQAPPRWARC
jgi:hypothetical protein